MITTSKAAPEGTAATPAPRPIGEIVDELSRRPDAPYVISCYVSLTPEDRANRKYLIAVRERLQRLERSELVAPLPHDERMAFERDVTRIIQTVSHPGELPHARGLAIFASESQGLFDIVPMPGVHRTRAVIDRTPVVGELAAAEEDFGRVVVAVVDRTHARLFEVTAAGAVEREDLFDPASRGGRFRGDRRDAPGFGERRYHQRIREERHRHYADVVHHLVHLANTAPTRGIVLAGPDDHTAALGHFFPRRMTPLILGTARLNPTATSPAEVQQVAFELAAQHDRAEVTSLLAAWREAFGREWAVDGPAATLRALANGQARRVFVRGDLAASGFRCAATGRLALEDFDCAGEGPAMPVADLVDEVIEEAVRQRIELVIVGPPAEADRFDRMAAQLRFHAQ